MMPRVVESNKTSRVRDFLRMNPLIFIVSKVNEDPQEFLHRVYKVLSAMGLTSREKAELASFNCGRFLNCGILNGKKIGRLSRVL